MIIDIYGKPYKLSSKEVTQARKMCSNIINSIKNDLPMSKYPTYFPTFIIMMHVMTGNLINNMNMDGFREALENLNLAEEEKKKE